MRSRFRQLVGVIVLMSALGCETASTEPKPPTCIADFCAVTGQIVWLDLEGGFFVIRDETGQNYDPINLPAEFRRDGLRVHAALRLRDDLVSFHMVGRIVEVLSIRER